MPGILKLALASAALAAALVSALESHGPAPSVQSDRLVVIAPA